MTVIANGANAAWFGSIWAATQNTTPAGGLLGALESAKGADGSLSSYLDRAGQNANAFASIAQSTTVNTSNLVIAQAAQNLKDANAKKLQQAMDALNATKAVTPKNVLDPVIFFENGSTLDTNSNVLTLADGRQIDAVTGTEIVDPASVVGLANGAYLDTKRNIMTLSDGTRIDTVTGLAVSLTA